MDSCRLEQGLATIRSQALPIEGLLVVRNGHVVVEAYGSPNDAHTLFDMESVTKSIVSGLLGVAIEEGHVDGIQSRVLDHFPDTVVNQPSAEKSAITIEDLLTMRSGLDYDNNSESFTSLTDSVAFILGHGMRAAPGTQWSYSSADVQLLSAILQRGVGMTTEQYALEKLFRPLGIVPGAWLKDASGITVGGFGLSLTLRDLTKIGQLYLDHGAWDGQQLIPAAWVDASVIARVDTPWTRGAMGYLWWVWKEKNAFRAGGRYGQQLAIFPSERLLVAYTAMLPLETADATLDGITTSYILGAIGTASKDASACTVSQTLGGELVPDGGPPCSNTKTQWIGASGLRLTPSNAVLAIGDGASTFCVSSPQPGKVCFRGTAADAGAQYTGWGTALLVRLDSVDAGLESPFDAQSAGIAGFRFTASGTGDLPTGLRVGVAEVDEPGLPNENNPFLAGAGIRNLKSDGSAVELFRDMTQPSWTKLPAGTVLDSSRLYALRFQVPASPGRSIDYEVCISDLAWVDASGEPLPPDR